MSKLDIAKFLMSAFNMVKRGISKTMIYLNLQNNNSGSNQASRIK